MGSAGHHILLIEDSAEHSRLTQHAFIQGNVRCRLSVVGDGVEALDCLRQVGQYAHAPAPDLILLDLNLPKKGGLDVLTEIKSDDQLKHIPVIVLTASSRAEDVTRSYQLHANAYIAKPDDLDRFIVALKSIEEFWLTLVKLPTRTGEARRAA